MSGEKNMIQQSMFRQIFGRQFGRSWLGEVRKGDLNVQHPFLPHPRTKNQNKMTPG